MQEKYKAIVEMTDCFFRGNLNDEYAQLILMRLPALGRKRPFLVETGDVNGITYAIGMVISLFDKSQMPHIGAKELYKKFGLGESTENAKSKAEKICFLKR